MVANYEPDVQEEINKALVAAEIAKVQTRGVTMPTDAPIADDVLLADGNVIQSMTQTSDPSSRGTVRIYNVETGLPSQVLPYMLAKKLSPNKITGKVEWSMTPTKPYFVGTTKCLLHEEHPRRKEWDSIGLAGTTCRKSNITSEFELRQHMLHRHRVEWSVMEEAREREEKDEERAFRRMQMEQWERMNQAPRRGRPPKDEEAED